MAYLLTLPAGQAYLGAQLKRLRTPYALDCLVDRRANVGARARDRTYFGAWPDHPRDRPVDDRRQQIGPPLDQRVWPFASVPGFRRTRDRRGSWANRAHDDPPRDLWWKASGSNPQRNATPQRSYRN